MRRCPECPQPRRTQYSGSGKGDICEVHGWVEAEEVVPAALLRAIREPIEDVYQDSTNWKDLRDVLRRIDAALAAAAQIQPGEGS